MIQGNSTRVIILLVIVITDTLIRIFEKKKTETCQHTYTLETQQHKEKNLQKRNENDETSRRFDEYNWRRVKMFTAHWSILITFRSDVSCYSLLVKTLAVGKFQIWPTLKFEHGKFEISHLFSFLSEQSKKRKETSKKTFSCVSFCLSTKLSTPKCLLGPTLSYSYPTIDLILSIIFRQVSTFNCIAFQFKPKIKISRSMIFDFRKFESVLILLSLLLNNIFKHS